MAVPPELRYTKEHEWVRVEGDVAAVGIAEAAAQEQLGNLVYLELPRWELCPPVREARRDRCR